MDAMGSTPADTADTGNGFYQGLCQNAAVALIAADARHRIVFWNAGASRLLGGEAADRLGQSLFDVVPPQRHSLLRRLLERTARRRQPSELEIQLPDPTGQLRDLMVVLSPIPAPDDGSLGVAVWIVDETQRKQLADQLAQAEKMASLGTLAGGVAHHFNNILGGVATFVDFALTSGDQAAMKRALQMTAEAAARVSKITQSLLSFAKCDTYRSDLADLTEVVLTFVHLVERPLAERGIRLELSLRPVPVIAVEANRMHQALGNLLTNAEEAMPGGGTVAISLHRDPQQVYLSMADTGCGIKAQHLPMVFEPFFTTKGLLAGGDKGNPGLGLSVAQGIVLDMGGRISVDSVEGQGATFTISFPVPVEPG
jgi:PAS domain S-box-containing protein